MQLVASESVENLEKKLKKRAERAETATVCWKNIQSFPAVGLDEGLRADIFIVRRLLCRAMILSIRDPCAAHRDREGRQSLVPMTKIESK